MVRPLISSIIFGALIFGSGAIACDTISKSGKIIPDTLTKSRLIAATPTNSLSITALEQSVHAQVNQYRKSRNLPPLSLDARITAQARAHSQAMAQGRVPFSHQGFDQRLKAISQVISYKSAAENVAYNQGYSDPAQNAVQGWIKSPGHRINMEGKFDLTGVGIAKNNKGQYYFTQIFIKRR